MFTNTHTPCSPGGCFCRVLEKKPLDTASSGVGYCSLIPQQINMYSARLYFIPSNFTLKKIANRQDTEKGLNSLSEKTEKLRRFFI